MWTFLCPLDFLYFVNFSKTSALLQKMVSLHPSYKAYDFGSSKHVWCSLTFNVSPASVSEFFSPLNCFQASSSSICDKRKPSLVCLPQLDCVLTKNCSATWMPTPTWPFTGRAPVVCLSALTIIKTEVRCPFNLLTFSSLVLVPNPPHRLPRATVHAAYMPFCHVLLIITKSQFSEPLVERRFCLWWTSSK